MEKLWRLVKVSLSCHAQETASSLLFDMGTTGIVILDERPGQVELGAYFDSQAAPSGLLASIERELKRACGCDVHSIEIDDIADSDWMQKWKEGYEPVEVGKRLIVAPSWKLPASSAGRKLIQIDPGMAFGTGAHATTRLCLEALEKYWRGGALLDVGAGTGILAIAAALLSPGSTVVAIDVDPIAVEIASENAALNGVGESVSVRQATPGDLSGSYFDVIVANLTAETIIKHASRLAGCLKKPGTVILSGILEEFAADVQSCISEQQLSIVDFRQAGEWVALVAGAAGSR
jgi:ribosomal protein L11 methyltransferase